MKKIKKKVSKQSFSQLFCHALSVFHSKLHHFDRGNEFYFFAQKRVKNALFLVYSGFQQDFFAKTPKTGRTQKKAHYSACTQRNNVFLF